MKEAQSQPMNAFFDRKPARPELRRAGAESLDLWRVCEQRGHPATSEASNVGLAIFGLQRLGRVSWLGWGWAGIGPPQLEERNSDHWTTALSPQPAKPIRGTQSPYNRIVYAKPAKAIRGTNSYPHCAPKSSFELLHIQFARISRSEHKRMWY